VGAPVGQSAFVAQTVFLPAPVHVAAQAVCVGRWKPPPPAAVVSQHTSPLVVQSVGPEQPMLGELAPQLAWHWKSVTVMPPATPQQVSPVPHCDVASHPMVAEPAPQVAAQA
jgi:hypothetical protein